MKIKSNWIMQEKMAVHCDMSLSGFRKWQVEPVAKSGGKVFYKFSDVLKNRLTHQESRLKKTASASEINRAEREAKLRLTQAQAESQETKNALLSRELAPAAIIEWTLGNVGAQIGAILDALPRQIKKRCPKLTPSGVEVIKRDIVRAQNLAAGIQVDFDQYEREHK